MAVISWSRSTERHRGSKFGIDNRRVSDYNTSVKIKGCSGTGAFFRPSTLFRFAKENEWERYEKTYKTATNFIPALRRSASGGVFTASVLSVSFWEERIYETGKVHFVTGGVVSGLGKGITAASLGRLLKARGLKVAAQKLDPYINVDPGTMARISMARSM